uniref:Nucleoside-diphosphatase uda-1 n=1 Tax=Angiostrongylus cantonensis TaxID=6313 RepID=A0A0K0CV53_ANGCA
MVPLKTLPSLFLKLLRCYHDVPCRFFAVIFDAGSTGTRLHLYRYVHSTDQNGLPFKVEEETFREVSPGLSSYSHDPPGASESIRSLIQIAHETIPPFMWDKTPITLKATAGLRLLPGDMADDILDAVEREIVNSGFFAVPNGVGIMSGSDEGIYSWLTLNLLLNVFYSDDVKLPYFPDASRTVAAFDLGGGSTQLTFWPVDQRIFEHHSEYRRDIEFFGHRMQLFTHSFLGNGLVAARLNTLLHITGDEAEVKHELGTPCMPSDFRLQDWEYALRKWTISGMQTYSFNACYDNARQFVAYSDVMKLPTLQGKMIYLFSYFFDRGLNAELVKEHSGGAVKLVDFKVAAEKACSRTKEELRGSHWLPWLCHDLTYIYSLLHDGYGFGDTQPFYLAKKLKGMEVAWAQGLSYILVDEFHKTHLSPVNRQINDTVVGQIMSYIYSGTNNLLSYLNIIS